MKLVITILFLSLSAFGQLPITSLTPGAVRTQDARDVCSQKARQFRHTSMFLKAQVCDSYELLDCPHAGVVELDHLIPLTLGGSDEEANLWPQLAEYPNAPGYHQKDKLEVTLHRMVCAQHSITLPEAQMCIARNWISCYKRVFGKEK